MEGKYIFAIIVLGIFFVLIFVSFAILEYGRIKEEKLQSWINERYSDNKLNKPDYDIVSAEDEVPVQNVQEFTAQSNDAEAETVDDEVTSAETFGKIEVEGIEEITGNYNGGDE